MRKFFKSLATVAVMGVPAWVVVAAVLGGDPATLVVRVEEPGVRVEVAGKSYPAVALQVGPLTMEPGDYVLNVVRGKEVLYSRPLRIAAGARKEVDARWRTETAAAGEAGETASRGALAPVPPSVLRGSADLAGHGAVVTGVGFSGDGRAVSVGGDRTLRFWDLGGGLGRNAVEPSAAELKGLLVLDGGRRVVTLGDHGQLEVHDAKTGAVLQRVDCGDCGKALCLAASPDGRSVALGGETGAVRVVHLETGAVRRVLDLSPASTGSLAFSPDGATLLVGLVGSPQTPHEILIYDLKAGRLAGHLPGHKAPVWGLAYLPDGRRAVSVGGDRTLRLWDVTAARELKSFPGQSGVGRCVAVSPDGRFAVAGTGHRWTFDGGWEAAPSYGVTVWDLDAGKVVGRYNTTAPVACLALSADGRRALAGGEDQIVHAIELPDAPARAASVSSETISTRTFDPPTAPADPRTAGTSGA